jgi:hypothetical protein
MAAGTLYIANYAAFRADLKKAMGSTKEATAAMKKAGVPVLAKAQAYAPKGSADRGDKHPGQLAGSGRILAGGNKGRVVFRQIYAPGAEFGAHGRWVGFEKWGQPPRFGYRALNDSADEVLRIVTEELLPVMTAYGWFH